MLAHLIVPKLLLCQLLLVAISLAPFRSYAEVHPSTHTATLTYTLERAIQRSQEIDPWILKSQFQQESLRAQSVSRSSLPDPSVNFGVANLPVDSFDFDQERMTQFTVGITQMLPRGQTLALTKTQFDRLSEVEAAAQKNRLAISEVAVSHLWLDVFKSQQTTRMIQSDKHLFEYLIDVSESSYAAGDGRTRQSDVVRAQLELTKIEDQLLDSNQKNDRLLAELAGWLVDIHTQNWTEIDITLEMPTLEILDQNLLEQRDMTLLYSYLTGHSAIVQLDKKIAALATGVSLAKQSYKPQWGVNASYGYREDEPGGGDRADLFSLNVSVDLPLFTENRQDKQLQSAIANLEAVKTQRALSVRELRSQFLTAVASYKGLAQRIELYKKRLLIQMTDQAEASLSAYTYEDGEFAEAVRSRISQLNARIELMQLEVELQKTIVTLNYYLVAGQQPTVSSTGELR
jgi:outer membrane protein TolC